LPNRYSSANFSIFLWQFGQYQRKIPCKIP